MKADPLAHGVWHGRPARLLNRDPERFDGGLADPAIPSPPVSS